MLVDPHGNRLTKVPPPPPSSYSGQDRGIFMEVVFAVMTAGVFVAALWATIQEAL